MSETINLPTTARHLEIGKSASFLLHFNDGSQAVIQGVITGQGLGKNGDITMLNIADDPSSYNIPWPISSDLQVV